MCLTTSRILSAILWFTHTYQSTVSLNPPCRKITLTRHNSPTSSVVDLRSDQVLSIKTLIGHFDASVVSHVNNASVSCAPGYEVIQHKKLNIKYLMIGSQHCFQHVIRANLRNPYLSEEDRSSNLVSSIGVLVGYFRMCSHGVECLLTLRAHLPEQRNPSGFNLMILISVKQLFDVG